VVGWSRAICVLGVHLLLTPDPPTSSAKNMSEKPSPTEIKLHQQSRVLEIAYDDGNVFSLPCEFLRVYSPSADVKGHGPGQGVLQVGKEDVNIRQIEPVGNYAVKLIFDDGTICTNWAQITIGCGWTISMH